MTWGGTPSAHPITEDIIMRRLMLAATSLALVATTLSPASAAIPGCAGPSTGGDWTSYGHDLSNSRNQPLENTIGPDNVMDLGADWAFNVADADADGSFQSTPAVSDGCVFLGTDSGWVFALNADDGGLVWKRQLEGGVFGMSVADGKLVALVNRTNEPYATALHLADGLDAWTPGQTPVPQVRDRLRTNASTVIYEDVVFMGYSVVEGDIEGHAGWMLVDLNTGEQLAHDYVIPEEDWDKGYGGGGVWTTGVVDDSGHVFVGTSNPTSKKIEHRQHNAVLKIDLNRFLDDGVTPNPTFGAVVDNAKGNFDQYYPHLDRQPACRETGDQILYAGFSVTCVQLDLDFGASPNLFTNDEGQTLVGILQKSGVYHTFYADTLQLAWTQVLAPPCLQCNFSSTALHGDSIYGVGTPPSQMVAFEQHQGAYEWIAPVGDGLHHQAVSTANGVVYTVDSLGNLNAFDAELGLPLLKRPIALDAGSSTVALSSSGIAIARHTLFVPAGDDLVAYRLPA